MHTHTHTRHACKCQNVCLPEVNETRLTVFVRFPASVVTTQLHSPAWDESKLSTTSLWLMTVWSRLCDVCTKTPIVLLVVTSWPPRNHAISMAPGVTEAWHSKGSLSPWKTNWLSDGRISNIGCWILWSES